MLSEFEDCSVYYHNALSDDVVDLLDEGMGYSELDGD
ncbi:hypothetical protein ES702_00178 [subsurface metagenome]